MARRFRAVVPGLSVEHLHMPQSGEGRSATTGCLRWGVSSRTGPHRHVPQKDGRIDDGNAAPGPRGPVPHEKLGTPLARGDTGHLWNVANEIVQHVFPKPG